MSAFRAFNACRRKLVDQGLLDPESFKLTEAGMAHTDELIEQLKRKRLPNS